MRVARQVAERLVAFAAQQGGLGLGVEFPGADVVRPRLLGGHGGLHRRDTASNLTNLGDGHVAVVRGGAVAGVPAHHEAALGRALLTNHHDDRVRAVAHRQVGAALLGEAVLPAERLRVELREVAGAEPAARLLVRHAHESQCAARAFAAQGHVAGGGGHRGGDVQHVGGAAAVESAVDNFGAEGVVRPLLLIDGHYVRVAEQREGLRGGVGTLDGKRDRHPPICGFILLDAHGSAVEKRFERGRVAVFSPRSWGKVVDTRILDKGS